MKFIPQMTTCLWLGLLPMTKADPGKHTPPNFVFILADDQGWNALSVRADPKDPASGSPYFKTPNLANLAKEGMRFSQAYSPAPTCSPTRHSIQFGRSPASLRIWGADGIKNWDALAGESLANVLEKARPEYTCAHFGKWHIGKSPETLGYQVNDGGNGNGVGNSKNPKDPKLIFSLSRKSMEFIETQAQENKPFFLQVSHYANHLKYQGLRETIGKYETEHTDEATEYHKDPLWAAMNENLDTGIGMILDKLEELNIADNTYVFYTADNGYESKKDFTNAVSQRGFYKAFPQRSHKYHVSEGGIRVPFIVRGPGIQAGSHSSSPVVGTDLFPTVLSLIGAAEKIPARVEGADLSGHLKSGGEKAIERKDPFLIFKFSKPRPPHDIAIVQKEYKLIKDLDTGESFLFNLETDIGESKDLSKEKPELARQLNKQMTEYFARFGWDESKINKRAKRFKKGSKLAPVPDNVTKPKKKTGSSEKKPNVVIIFIDDMGYGDIGPFGSKINKTPHLNRMAAEGLKFTDFYVASQSCTPSRAALLTGCYAKRVGMDGRVCFPNEPKALNPSEYTMAKMFKDAGYATGCFGKWHLGHMPGYLPNDHGFDVYEGIPYSNDMWAPYDSINKKWKIKGWKVPLPWLVDGKAVAVVKNPTDQGLLTQATTKAALNFIREQGGKKEPFFVYLPYATVHLPRVGHPDFLPAGAPPSKANKKDAEFTVHLTAQIEELDAAVGNVFSTLKELGVEKNTIVIFMSDNGGSRGTSKGPLKGGKGSEYEGGPRTPFLIHWPESIPAGKVSHEIGVSSDLLPTFAKLCGGKLSGNKIDGRDLSDLFLNPDTAKSPHEGFAHKNAYRLGKWKVVGKRLFDLEKDLGETRNIAKQYPEVLKKLSDKNKKFFSKIESEIRPHAKMPNLSPIIDEQQANALPDLEKWLKDIEGYKNNKNKTH